MKSEARKEKVVRNENPESFWAVMAERKGRSAAKLENSTVTPSGRQGAMEAGAAAAPPGTGRRRSGETPPAWGEKEP